MNTQYKIKSKGIYSTPEILKVKLDNDISLILASDINPMGDPSFTMTLGEELLQSPMDQIGF